MGQKNGTLDILTKNRIICVITLKTQCVHLETIKQCLKSLAEALLDCKNLKPTKNDKTKKKKSKILPLNFYLIILDFF